MTKSEAAAHTTPTVKSIRRDVPHRATGQLSDGTYFEVVKHLGSGRFEIRHADQGVGRGKSRRLLTPVQRIVIRCHPVARLVRDADIHRGEGGEE